jgi:hypothetical protein
VGINLSCFRVGVPEELLDRAKGLPRGGQARCKCMAQVVKPNCAHPSGATGGLEAAGSPSCHREGEGIGDPADGRAYHDRDSEKEAADQTTECGHGRDYGFIESVSVPTMPRPPRHQSRLNGSSGVRSSGIP